MYTKRVQLINYGPIERLDVEFPFDGDRPKPVVLVGENGSGKSILLSQIVNGLIDAKSAAYPETPEVESGKVYKLRSNSYIRSGMDYYFARVDFEDSLFVGEMRLTKKKRQYETIPPGLSPPEAKELWDRMTADANDNYMSSFARDDDTKIEDIFAKNCALYFPPNRFEEPAWLNEENLKARAHYMDLKYMKGQTSRKVINYSPLHDNQNWLFDVIYDSRAFEIQTVRRPFTFNNQGRNVQVPLPVFLGYSGHATSVFETALQVVRTIVRRQNIRFGLGGRKNRVVSLESDTAGPIVPNIFQLSSGETSLLNLFLSILRDFDLCGTPYSHALEIRGIVVVDEIDLHLHAVHQHDVLPQLVNMFPKIQFVVTTHSPLFVLGMNKVFGDNGFALYRLPHGHRISPEEFGEFGSAYQVFIETKRFSDDVRTAIESAQKPIVFVEGATDQRYLQKAAQLLGQQAVLEEVDVRDGTGAGHLKRAWNNFKSPLPDIVPQKVLLLFDCDEQLAPSNKGKLFRRTIPFQADNPIQTGIENLFSKTTLEKARRHKLAFIDVDDGRTKTVRGEARLVPEKWTVNEDEKTNLCDWLCDNGTEDDFRKFGVVFELMREVLGLSSVPTEEIAVGEAKSSDSLPTGDSVADIEKTALNTPMQGTGQENNGRRANSVDGPGYGGIFLEHIWRDGTVTCRTH